MLKKSFTVGKFILFRFLFMLILFCWYCILTNNKHRTQLNKFTVLETLSFNHPPKSRFLSPRSLHHRTYADSIKRPLQMLLYATVCIVKLSSYIFLMDHIWLYCICIKMKGNKIYVSVYHFWRQYLGYVRFTDQCEIQL